MQNNILSNEYRILEKKFGNEIKYHLVNALPILSEKFCFCELSTDEEDNKYSFDIIFDIKFTVSVRIRKFKYIKYNDLTIRSKSKKNGYCELDKIKDGMGQVYFYAYMNEQETELIKIRICNVETIRKLLVKHIYTGPQSNLDGTQFLSFRFSDINNYGGAIYKYDKLYV